MAEREARRNSGGLRAAEIERERQDKPVEEGGRVVSRLVGGGRVWHARRGDSGRTRGKAK